MNLMIENLKTWVIKNYDSDTTGWTAERSAGNFDDCFNDGFECGTSWAAYEVGRILGMDLEEPEESDYEEEF